MPSYHINKGKIVKCRPSNAEKGCLIKDQTGELLRHYPSFLHAYENQMEETNTPYDTELIELFKEIIDKTRNLNDSLRNDNTEVTDEIFHDLVKAKLNAKKIYDQKIISGDDDFILPTDYELLIKHWTVGNMFHGVGEIFKKDGDYDDESRREISHQLQSWSSGLNFSESYNRISFNGRTSGINSDLYEVFLENLSVGNKKKYLFIDIETTGLDPLFSDVIEIGYSLTDSSFKKVLEQDSILFNVDDSRIITSNNNKVPVNEVHKIDYEMIRDKISFKEWLRTEEGSSFVDLLNSEDVVLVAHNARFEFSWFSHLIPGFWESHRVSLDPSENDKNLHGVIDTVFISDLFDSEVKSNLKLFAESFGIEYKDAHRALNDALIMKDTMSVLLEKLIKSL